jgi:hypothetical protein
MLEALKATRLLSLREQYLKAKAEAKKSMNKGDLKSYFEKLNKTNKLKQEFSETLNMKV